jgi:hypothetical protein
MAYCTKEQVKTYLRIDGTGDDDLFDNELIPAAQAIIDMATGRVFEASAATAKTFDADGDGVSEDGLTLYLGEQDLAELTSITNGDGTAISTSSVVTLPRRVTPYYGLEIKSSAGVVWTWDTDPVDAISITGKWAYSTAAPQDIVHATVRMVAWLFKQRDSAEDVGQPRMSETGVVMMPLGLPEDVKQYIKPYRRLI